ncbi:MAG: amidase family protein [Burkholderiaceae bacterium]
MAFTRNMLGFTLDPRVDKALLTARDAARAGYEVVEADLPMFKEASTDALRALFGEVKALMAADVRKHGSKTINQVFDDYFRAFPPYEGNELLLAMARRSAYVRAWQLFLEEYPLVLTPFLPAPTYAWDRDTQGADGVREVMGQAVYSSVINFVGLPAGNIAADFNDGLPIGVQLIGRRFREDQILDACEAIEQRVRVMAERLFARDAAGSLCRRCQRAVR